MSPDFTVVHMSAEDKSGQLPSLKDKLRHHYLFGQTKARSKHAARAAFVLQAVTQIYVTLHVLLPFVFEDVHPWVLYCLRVWACHLCVMSVANWVCVICYSNEYRPSRDRPDINLHVLHHPERFEGRLDPRPRPHPHPHANGHAAVDVTEKGGLPWTFCQQCDMSVPPRAHHCKFCRRCMLRRDHHCHLVGCCIGHWNQRFFVVLAAYGMVVGYVGAFLTLTYLRHHHPPHLTAWTYFFPVSFYQWVMDDIGGLHMLLIYHAYMLCLFGPVSNIYFLSQMSIIAQGKTLHEVAKGKPYKVTSSVQDNVRLVFGDYWLLNFLLPAQILFKQPSDGLHYPGVKVVPHPDPSHLPEKRAVD
ncbi:putative palmitoyltransferase ZDHHC24 [Babylonia areolata]|uniref:putative palmitoyltransferase ZDHHC24 n=1 Tax=Babylonia areolata TaxID=304850 RepID=UPI003FD2B5A9